MASKQHALNDWRTVAAVIGLVALNIGAFIGAPVLALAGLLAFAPTARDAFASLN